MPDVAIILMTETLVALCPELIYDGYIYAGVPPLYKVTIGKEYKYLKNDEALEEFRKTHQGRKYIVNRLKG